MKTESKSNDTDSNVIESKVKVAERLIVVEKRTIKMILKNAIWIVLIIKRCFFDIQH
jgi:hypothetical protein